MLDHVDPLISRPTNGSPPWNKLLSWAIAADKRARLAMVDGAMALIFHEIAAATNLRSMNYKVVASARILRTPFYRCQICERVRERRNFRSKSLL